MDAASIWDKFRALMRSLAKETRSTLDLPDTLKKLTTSMKRFGSMNRWLIYLADQVL